jgi:hypothetical protein
VEKSHRNTHKKRGLLFQREGSISGLAFSDTFPSLYSLGFVFRATERKATGRKKAIERERERERGMQSTITSGERAVGGEEATGVLRPQLPNEGLEHGTGGDGLWLEQEAEETAERPTVTAVEHRPPRKRLCMNHHAEGGAGGASGAGDGACDGDDVGEVVVLVLERDARSELEVAAATLRRENAAISQGSASTGASSLSTSTSTSTSTSSRSPRGSVDGDRPVPGVASAASSTDTSLTSAPTTTGPLSDVNGWRHRQSGRPPKKPKKPKQPKQHPNKRSRLSALPVSSTSSSSSASSSSLSSSSADLPTSKNGTLGHSSFSVFATLTLILLHSPITHPLSVCGSLSRLGHVLCHSRHWCPLTCDHQPEGLQECSPP